MKWLDKLQRKFGKFYIPNLMWGVIILSAASYIITYFFLGTTFLNKLVLDPDAVMKGEIWRLVTFVIIPPITNIIGAFFTLYFDYIAGVSLEEEWGEFKFNVYFFVAMIVSIIFSFVTGVPLTGAAITTSIFLAFAKLFPHFKVLLFFIIPLEVRWLGYLAWATILFGMIKGAVNGSIISICAAALPIVNYLLFFGKSFVREKKMRAGSVIRMSDYKKKTRVVEKRGYTHKCTVCGITDVDDPDMDFRYCSKCNGKHAYCEKHIKNHTHIE